MTKNLLRTGAFLLALVLAPLAVTAGAHDRKGRKHRHDRKGKATVVHVNHRNPTPGVARRVRRGRNLTPGVRRGAITSTTTRRNRAGAAVALEHRKGHRGHGKH
ncbi:MAG: hypothetical protein LC800_12245 [Acidobacteria bacterium]|nr:hypothetical protein [Acidobacteriota bacterium]